MRVRDFETLGERPDVSNCCVRHDVVWRSMSDSPGGMRTHGGFDPDQQEMFSRRRLLFAGAAVAGTLGIWARSSGSSPGGASAGATTSTTIAGQSPQTLIEPNAVAAPTTVAFAPLQGDISHDMVGPEVERVQTRLAAVGFDPGPIDGVYGGSTERSVWAYEKLILGTPREQMQGVVTADIWERMNQPTGVAPRRAPGGMHLEIYLPEQTAVLFIDGGVRLISHIASGSEVEWCAEVVIDKDDGTQETKGICGDAVTPGGVYHFERKIDGWRSGKLGRLYKPTYFNYGIAIHGAGNVPAAPASKGCVRFPMHIAEYLQDLVSIGDAVYVFDGVEEPETYGAQPMTFDWPDPDWVPPSTTTTTTTPTTTTPSATPTTVPNASTTSPTHTVHPGSTTTTAPATTTPVSPATVPPSTSIPPSG